FSVTAKDAYNNVTPAYRGTVHFTSSDGNAVLPANYTFTSGDAGIHTGNSATLKTAGLQSITIASADVSTLVTSLTRIANPAPTAPRALADHTAPPTRRSPDLFSVTAKDAYNNVTPAYRGTVHFTSSDGNAVLPANYTFTSGDAGIHTGNSATLKTAGLQSI